jgi:hypothetical protein
MKDTNNTAGAENQTAKTESQAAETQKQTTVKESSSKKVDAKETKSKLTTKHVVLILGSLIIIAAAIIIIMWLRDRTDINDMDVPRGNMVAVADNLGDIRAELEERIERGMFETHMTTVWTFDNGGAPSFDAVMGNSPNNRYPFWFTVTLQGTDEPVYTSGLMPVGTELTEIILDRHLPAGDYSAIVAINMIDDDDIPVDSNVGLGIRIIVRN